MLPTLKALADGSEAPVRDIRERVAAFEGLASEEVREMLPSGRQMVNDMGHAELPETRTTSARKPEVV